MRVIKTVVGIGVGQAVVDCLLRRMSDGGARTCVHAVLARVAAQQRGGGVLGGTCRTDRRTRGEIRIHCRHAHGAGGRATRQLRRQRTADEVGHFARAGAVRGADRRRVAHLPA